VIVEISLIARRSSQPGIFVYLLYHSTEESPVSHLNSLNYRGSRKPSPVKLQ
jgi:hypothetical protein